MNKILYCHGGSGNKGCEAIVRSTLNILGTQNTTVLSNNLQEDLEAGLDQICSFGKATIEIKRHSLIDWMIKGWYFLFKSQFLTYHILYHPLEKVNWKNAIAVSVGGDNYCYDGSAPLLSRFNKNIKRKGGISILWGCSIEPWRIDRRLINDLRRYDLITARESITYNALKKAGIKHVYLYPDPAFTLPVQPVDFNPQDTIGINLSPYMLANAATAKQIKNELYDLLDWILQKTELHILFISHVEKPGNSDIETVLQNCEPYLKNPRINILPSEYNCMETKDIISKCRFFIGARTHATIAAYSTGVPTLVVGYSVKALGIAKDIWGEKDNLIVDTRTAKGPSLLDKFKYMYKHEHELRDYLKEFIPGYIAHAWKAGDLVQNYEN